MQHPPAHLSPEELRNARYSLGQLWGLGRSVSAGELSRILRLNAATGVRDLERGRGTVSGPMSVAILMMLAGASPPDGIPADSPGLPADSPLRKLPRLRDRP